MVFAFICELQITMYVKLIFSKIFGTFGKNCTMTIIQTIISIILPWY